MIVKNFGPGVPSISPGREKRVNSRLSGTVNVRKTGAYKYRSEFLYYHLKSSIYSIKPMVLETWITLFQWLCCLAPILHLSFSEGKKNPYKEAKNKNRAISE